MKTTRLLALLATLFTLFASGPARAAPGDLDPLNAALVGGSVMGSAVQPDGKTIIVGYFTSVLGVPRNRIARLNADGTLDMGFDPKPDGVIQALAVQADGKVLIGGGFTTFQPNGAAAATARQNSIVRLNADGTLDMGFDPPKPDSGVLSIAVQADGKVLLGGYFTTLQPNGAGAAIRRQYIARVNADGTLDTGFDPKPNDYVYTLAVQEDGKVLLGGHFTTLQPNGAGATTARQRIARVNADGTLDMGFDPKVNGSVHNVAVQADGKVLLGGFFSTLQPNGAGTATARNNIARVNADGTLDPGFDPKPNGSVHSVAVQADGKLLLGGQFTNLPNGAGTPIVRQFIARVNADGTLDSGFDPRANSFVYTVALQADGKLQLGGDFTTLRPNGAGTATPRHKFARLLNDAATQTLSAPDATHVTWTRGGSTPEISQVTFEQSTDSGATWTPLGNGTRVATTANWQLTGLSLPGSGQLRARGRTTGGYFNGSSGLVETVISYSVLAADAGSDFGVNEGQAVALDGSASAPNDGSLGYAWVQLTPGDYLVALTGATTAAPTFIAPTVAIGGATLTFQLTVTSVGSTSVDTVSVSVVNMNHAPVADAGTDQSIAEGSPVTLHGEASFDIDNDVFTYHWVQIDNGAPMVTLTGDDTKNPTFTTLTGGSNGAAGVIATLLFELRVDDGFPPDAPAPGYALDSVRSRVTVEITNTNNPPIARTGTGQTVNEQAAVTLNGTTSSDPDSDTLTYSWTQVGPQTVTLTGALTATPGFTAPWVNVGGADFEFELTVDDGYEGIATARVIVHVQNINDPPLATAAQPSVASLWPPNHQMVAVSITGVTDLNNNATITITKITQDEPTNGLGDGDMATDAIINADGTFLLRAERSGTGDGRVYRIHFTATDAEGSTSGVVLVKVPHSVKKLAINSLSSFDSTN